MCDEFEEMNIKIGEVCIGTVVGLLLSVPVREVSSTMTMTLTMILTGLAGLGWDHPYIYIYIHKQKKKLHRDIPTSTEYSRVTISPNHQSKPRHPSHQANIIITSIKTRVR